MKEPFKVYVGVVATETTEGRGRTRPYGYYCTHEDATQAVKGKSAWGSDGYVREDWAITLEEEGEETTYLLGDIIDVTPPTQVVKGKEAKRVVVGHVVSHTGKRGGPWEAQDGEFGTPTTDFSKAERAYLPDFFPQENLDLLRNRYPDADVIPIVRKSKPKQKAKKKE